MRLNGQTLKDDTIIAWDDESFRNMIEHNKKGALHVYVEHNVDIPQYVEYESSDDVDKNCESYVGQGGIVGPGRSVFGEAAFEGEEAIVEGERLTAFKGPKANFHGVEIASEGEETSNFHASKIGFQSERSSGFEGEETSAFEVTKGGSKIAFEGEPTDGFVGETEGVPEV
ncbi:hypothetical protein V6N12_068943 [Hibiscus sabdariffa]|uniref:Uncharacterized protein n=1 Tax=Hibiscus sabdariffa TaxID=183260 RepID=A0ABR2CA91_9ROSI